MARRFRLTCSRTAYFDIDVNAESAAEAEMLLQAALAGDGGLGDSLRPVGQPVDRVVEVSALEDEVAALHEAAA
jgi:hypothetical protein